MMKLFAIIAGAIFILIALIVFPFDLYKELDSIRLVGGDAYNLIIASNIVGAKFICSCMFACFGVLIITLSAIIKDKGK